MIRVGGGGGGGGGGGAKGQQGHTGSRSGGSDVNSIDLGYGHFTKNNNS